MNNEVPTLDNDSLPTEVLSFFWKKMDSDAEISETPSQKRPPNKGRGLPLSARVLLPNSNVNVAFLCSDRASDSAGLQDHRSFCFLSLFFSFLFFL